MSKYWNISAPISAHVEVTDACNEKCKHCYNFDRSESAPRHTITDENLDNTIAELIKNKVMHVIITGGEPTLVMDKLVYLAEKCLANNITISLNSNMKDVGIDKLNRLKDAGIDHILTSLHSDDNQKHDEITGTVGDSQSTIRSIRNAQSVGIRVTINTVLTKQNVGDIYKIGKKVFSIGVGKFLVNRVIPSPSNPGSFECVDKDDVLNAFDDLIRLKKMYGMEVGTCRTVPMCLFPDLEKYKDFTDRGCAGGKKHILLNVNGDAHACVSDDTVYGNIHEIGIAGVWENMQQWRSSLVIPKECRMCHLFDRCDAGCRMVALHCTGKIDGLDNLRNGFYSRVEGNFNIVRIRGAKVLFVDK